MSKIAEIMAGMALYISTCTVKAVPMNRQEYNDLRGWEVPDNENPTDDGYLVVNGTVSERNVEGFDGYVSWLPKTAFEEQYECVVEAEDLANDEPQFDFGLALHFLKDGKKVARKGWNGAGQFVYYVPANKYPADQNPNSPIKGHFENDQVPYRAYLALKTAQNDVATWQPSISDVLAEDWVIVE